MRKKQWMVFSGVIGLGMLVTGMITIPAAYLGMPVWLCEYAILEGAVIGAVLGYPLAFME
jgi:hypothetical protein